jgi:putative phosphoribosyl transferase
MFRDRQEAGERLAAAVATVVDGPSVVLAIPRGGVVVGAPVARALRAPLDVVVPRKVGAPHNPELGLGAVAPGVRVLDRRLIAYLEVDEAYLDRAIAREEREIERRTAAYRQGLPPLDLHGRTAVVVDDGVATGGTAIAAIRWAAAEGAASVVFAAPVAPPDTVVRLQVECDHVVIPLTPDRFSAVGEWYDRFDQVGDDEVCAVLAEAAV